jgi:hypothetical protein
MIGVIDNLVAGTEIKTEARKRATTALRLHRTDARSQLRRLLANPHETRGSRREIRIAIRLVERALRARNG